jgi:ubiquinone biosynthesis protein UbiJ
VLQGEKPAIRIEGDVQLAAEVNWLIDHVRWDPEEDVARLMGDAPAHTLVQTAKRAVDALRSFVQQQTAKAAP